jgi:hypothetical protein
MIFNGYLVWNGKRTETDQIIDFFGDKKNVFFTKFIDSMMGYHDAAILKLFRLEYRHRLTEFEKKELAADCAFNFKSGNIKQVGLGVKSIGDWISENSELKYFLLKMAELEAHGYNT